MNIIGKRKIWYLISLILIVPGIVGIILWRLPLGIDFHGGTLLEISYSSSQNDAPTKETLIEKIQSVGVKNINVQIGENKTFIIRTEPLTNETTQKLTTALAEVGEYKQNRLDFVGPTVSADLKWKAIISVIVASLAIIVYIAIAFRRLPRPASSWRFGACAVFALIHDILFVVGSFAILGHFFGYEIDSLFITALLTIMGFSVHDTIVVFDRIRENLRLPASPSGGSPSSDFETNVNNSILQTLNRSLNTSFTVLIVLLALYLLGGETLKQFMLTLLLGIAIGTYSSIFNASPLLVSWQGWATKRLSKKVAT